VAAAIDEPSDAQIDEATPDAVETEPNQEIVERIEAVLALKPTQKKFTDDQVAVMRSMGWPVDDMTVAEVLHFQYFCAARNLDPFLREVMPLKTKDGIVPIIRIAGMRKIAEDTGAYEGLTKHFEFQDGNGDWHEGWPSATEKPVACRIGVYKRGWREPVEGSCRTDEAEVYERVELPNGTVEWVLTERWRERLFTMLKTTAEADGLRRAFPEHLSGIYTHEEMARVRREREQEYLRKVAAEGRARRRDFMRAAVQPGTDEQAEPERVEVVEGVHEGVVVERQPERIDPMAAARDLIRSAQAYVPEPRPEATSPVEDTPAADVAEAPPVEVPAAPDPAPEDLPLSDDDRKACLLAELAEQATILGATPEFLAQRFTELADGEPLAAWSSDLLLRVVTAWRKGVVGHLEKAGRYEEARAYAEWGPKDVDRVEILFGRGRP
jgi:phage recombination protein Bet